MSVLGAKSKCANTGDYLLQAKHHPGHFPSTLLFLSTSTLRELIAVNVASCARRRNEQQKKKKKKKQKIWDRPENYPCRHEKEGMEYEYRPLNQVQVGILSVSLYSIVQNFYFWLPT